MKVLKYRTIAHVYPHLSFEAMVELDNGEIVYANVSVNNTGEPEEYSDALTWIYKMPLDEVDFDDDDCYYEASEEEFEEIGKELIRLWNANPVFIQDYEWKEL